jgi:hypothetical protein
VTRADTTTPKSENATARATPAAIDRNSVDRLLGRARSCISKTPRNGTVTDISS